jgi:DNA replication ATP-dependent helicase Dna2
MTDSNVQAPREQPDFPISSTTRNKLNVFQYEAEWNDSKRGRPLASASDPVELEDKENIATNSGDKVSNQIAKQSLNFSSKTAESSKPRVEPPKTPAAKLALPDLIGMVDAKKVEQHISPDERVTWDHNASIHSSISSYGALKRAKKRARSSSPTSSPGQASTHSISNGEAFDLHRLSQSLKTPQRDPSLELWDRYGLSTDKGAPQEPQIPALAHIMYTSSPQSSKDALPRSEGTLRKSMVRSSTCGTQWPKRIKAEAREQGHGGDFFSEPFNTGASKLSLVSTLLGKVKEGYTSTEMSNPYIEPSSSSPIPLGRKALVKMDGSSPLSHVRTVAVKTEASKEIRPDDDPSHQPQLPVGKLGYDIASNTSDYGDFDDDVFDESMAEATNTETASLPTIEAGSLVESQQPSSLHTVAGMTPQEDSDEFGDMDEADLEDIAAKYDTNVSSEVMTDSIRAGLDQKDGTGKAALEHVNVGSDDEFGEDFDDNDFEEAAAATQSFQQSASTMPSVRTRFS